MDQVVAMLLDEENACVQCSLFGGNGCLAGYCSPYEPQEKWDVEVTWLSPCSVSRTKKMIVAVKSRVFGC
ncbi:hypothetical protein HPP92_011101 [Vanilla planifolia]|uniref:Uncharacterized protein n=1 Tax=Vanilla planifolia TaxID=51239 RepID=A0A835R5D4_VANPL|nr:hypothetical protein HPP92_011101 [Vanilla planifolia]